MTKFKWPRHADGTMKKPGEFTDAERRDQERSIDERIEHEHATADYGDDTSSDE
jgi:hypothetical protein